MIVVDQPVDFQQPFFVLVEVRRCEGSRVETVLIIQDCPYGIDIGLNSEAAALKGIISPVAGRADIMELVKACKSFRNLTKVQHGEAFRVHVTPDGGLRSVAFDLDEESYVTWVREGDTYVRHDGTYPVERKLKGIGGTIEIRSDGGSLLEGKAEKAQLDDEIAQRRAGIVLPDSPSGQTGRAWGPIHTLLCTQSNLLADTSRVHDRSLQPPYRR